jgi:cytochrome P450
MQDTDPTSITELDLPAFDYTDDGLAGDRFHRTLGDLRKRSWIARAGEVGYLVLDREGATFFLRTPKAKFPGRLMLEIQGVSEGPLYERMKGNLLDLDGADHRRQRKLVQPSFTPPAADRHRPAMRRVLAELHAAVERESRCDFVEAFAKPYPATIIAELMGAPAEDAGRLGKWANLIQGQFDPVKMATILPEIERASEEFVAYTRALIAARRGNAREDLISELIAAEEEGDRLTEDECIHLVSAVLVGGVDTTQAQLAHGIRLFATHPEQWAKLREDPGLAEAATEEVLRYEPITPLTARITREEIVYRNVVFPQGTIVLAASASANRDPDGWEAPEKLDIAADRGRAKPLTFGAGPHFCLGANLARAELQEAFVFLSQRMPELRLDGEPGYDTPLGVYGLTSLPIAW